jgi:hypothetical protein
MKDAQGSEAAFLRQLVQEKTEEHQQETTRVAEQGTALDQLWAQKRAEYADNACKAAKAEVVRRARKAAAARQTSLRLELGVDEKRLRASSQTAALNLAQAVLTDRSIEAPDWAYLERIGWIFQSRDGKALSPQGQVFVKMLQGMGLGVRFAPFCVRDSYSDPFSNAALEITW